MSGFRHLLQDQAILQRIERMGYREPTPIQEAAIPHILEGKNLMAAAPTGTGKTAAFMLPVLELLGLSPRVSDEDGYVFPRVLLIAPTRELAQQLVTVFRDYGRNTGMRCLLVCGGLNPREVNERLQQGGDIVVATPGRLYELMTQDRIELDHLKCLILDEADRLLDLGFADDLQLIVRRLPRERQNLLFSATFDKAVRTLANELMPGAIELGQKDANRASTSVRQWLIPVDHSDKGDATVTLLKENRWPQVMVFTKTKKGADGLTEQLKREGLQAEVLHGDKAQAERNRILDAFRERKLRILVATDVAARGIDIEHLPAVINHDLPPVALDYIHRIGRTGRAGEKGIAISLVAAHEVDTLTAIETLIGRVLPREDLIGHVPNHRVPETGPGKKPGTRRPEKKGSKKAKAAASAPAPVEKGPLSNGNVKKKPARPAPEKAPAGRGGNMLSGRKKVTRRTID